MCTIFFNLLSSMFISVFEANIKSKYLCCILEFLFLFPSFCHCILRGVEVDELIWDISLAITVFVVSTNLSRIPTHSRRVNLWVANPIQYLDGIMYLYILAKALIKFQIAVHSNIYIIKIIMKDVIICSKIFTLFILFI